MVPRTTRRGERRDTPVRFRAIAGPIKRWMDILIPAFIILPFSIFMIYLTSDYVLQSYGMDEVSPDPGGLPYRYLVKGLLPLGFILIALQGVALFFSLGDLVNDPHLQAVDFWHTRTDPELGTLRFAGIPTLFSDSPGAIRKMVPRLGEHTIEVLREGGVEENRITALLAHGGVYQAGIG